MRASDLTGQDETLRARLGTWLGTTLGRRCVVEAITPLAGGLVNVVRTMDVRIADSGERVRFVLRWDPIEGPHAPYDMAGQFRLFEALVRARLSVPRPLWVEEDAGVIGRTFWVSEFVAGETMGRLLPPDAAPARLASYVDALAAIHGADWRAAGLDAHAPVIGPDAIAGLIEAAAADFAYLPAADLSLFERARAALHAAAPRGFEPALTHGDCSLSNYLFRGDAVAAVVDWDLLRITDPALDLGYYCAISDRFQMDIPPNERAARRARVVDAYRRRTGRALASLAFWELYSLFFNALTWVRPGWDGQSGGFAAYRARIAELLD